ncbi:MAG: L,D-transpeptidase family protein [Bacteroidota bacterium]
MHPLVILICLPLFLFACHATPAEEEHSATPNSAQANSSSTQIEQDPPEEAEVKPPHHRQFLVSLTSDWDEVNGTLYLFTWENGQWVQSLSPIPMVVGKKGMAWGIGLDNYTRLDGPKKREGDKKSPAGVFRLGTAFGYAQPSQASFIKAEYTHVLPSTMCIEDASSAHYNQIVDEGSSSPDWNSTDHMLRKDDLYEWGMFVLHNQPDPVASGGSCIFLHVWRKNDSGTAGCTAMDKGKLKALLGKIDPSLNPLMVQVPVFAYEQFQHQYKLPSVGSMEE